jgi:glycosyltransferase involved in cell wall biosynthesis
MSDIQLSVIIPAYKFCYYIDQSVMSALWQKTNFEFEVLVRDDFSPDKTDTVLSKIAQWNPRLKYFKATENWGFMKNIQFLLNQAKGKYVAYLDGDDYYIFQDKLQKAFDFLEQNSNYSMVSFGYYRKMESGEFFPDMPYEFFGPLDDTINLAQISQINKVQWGRVFKNIPNLIKPWMYRLPTIDWAINYEVAKSGLIKNIDEPWGVYRQSQVGLFNPLSEEEKKNLDRIVQNEIQANYESIQMKTITIVDSYVYSENVRLKLEAFVKMLNEDGHEILLVSNTMVGEEILKHCKYYLYDSNNRLFQDIFEDVKDINLWKVIDGFQVNEHTSGLQKHGLSVMVNLFNALRMAKSLGYTHFQRMEADDLFGIQSRQWISEVPNRVLSAGKKGLYYYNYTPKVEQEDVSFHYQFCEIDLFLKSVTNIEKQRDYYDYLCREFGRPKFIIVEEFLYRELKRNCWDELLIRNTEDQSNDFIDTHWNTEISISNMSEKYRGCSTRLFKHWGTDENGETYDRGGRIVFTYNYSDETKDRIVEIVAMDDTIHTLKHVVYGKAGWAYNVIDWDFKCIRVYEKEELLYEESNLVEYWSRRVFNN